MCFGRVCRQTRSKVFTPNNRQLAKNHYLCWENRIMPRTEGTYEIHYVYKDHLAFLSPDNYIQAPDHSQSFNRYSYCLNNPLKYTDPSGESIVLAVLVGAFWSSAMSLAVNFDNISTDVDFVNTVTLGALGGAVGGAAGFVAGVLGTTGAIPGFLTSASGGFAGGFAGTSVTSWCTGATFGDGLMAGLKAGAIGGLTAGLIGAHNGAIDAINGGGNPWTGEGTVLGCQTQPSGKYNKSKQTAKQNAVKYKYSKEVTNNEVKLQKRINKLFQIKNKRNIGSITTKASNGFGMTDDCKSFVHLEDMSIADGYVVKARSILLNKWDVHISPGTTLNPSDVLFKAVAGHELTHVFHHVKFGDAYDNTASETACYDYTIRVLYDGGYVNKALNYMRMANDAGYNLFNPAYYSPY